MRILSVPETSKGEFHLQKHVEASQQVTVEQWYFQISIQDCTLRKLKRSQCSESVKSRGPAYAFSEKTKIF